MVMVKNNAVQGITEVEKLIVPTYATWYDKILFNGSRHIDTIYKVLTLLVALALVIMIVVEIKKQHFLHIVYGISLIILLQLFIYINQSFF